MCQWEVPKEREWSSRAASLQGPRRPSDAASTPSQSRMLVDTTTSEWLSGPGLALPTVAAVTSPEQPYGPLVSTVLRAVTWNVWGRFGPWQQRQRAIDSVLAASSPDLVFLQEAWSAVDGGDQVSAM